MAKFPLHRRQFQRRGQSQTEPLEQDLLVLGGLADAALSDHHAGSGRQRHVDQGGLGQGLENLPRLVAQSGLAAAGGQGRRLVLLLLKLSQGVFRRPNEVAPPTFPQELAQQFQSQPGAAELTAASYTNPLHIDFHPAGLSVSKQVARLRRHLRGTAFHSQPVRFLHYAQAGYPER